MKMAAYLNGLPLQTHEWSGQGQEVEGLQKDETEWKSVLKYKKNLHGQHQNYRGLKELQGEKCAEGNL